MRWGWLLLVLGLSSFAVAADKVMVMALFADKAMVAIDGHNYLLRVGGPAHDGVRLLAADSSSALLDIDGKQRRMALNDQIGSSYSQTAPSQVTVWPNLRGMYTTPGSINGQPVDFLVDTGASDVAMNAAQARSLGIDYMVNGEQSMVKTASGVVPSYSVTLDRVSVGEITLHQVNAVVLGGSQPDHVLLGMTFLGRLNIQRNGQAMVLQKKW